MISTQLVVFVMFDANTCCTPSTRHATASDPGDIPLLRSPAEHDPPRRSAAAPVRRDVRPGM